MKFVMKIALALAVGGAGTSAWAQSGPNAPEPLTQASSVSLLPLPQASPSWGAAPAYQAAPEANYAAPTGYVSAPVTVATPPTPPAETASPTPVDSTVQPMAADPIANSGNCWDNYCAEKANGGCGCGGCGCGGTCGCGGCCGPWYGYAGGIIMTRNQPNKFWTSYQTNNNANQIMNTDNANIHFNGGEEITLGRCFGCGEALEATYWGLDNMKAFSSVTDANNLVSTPMDLGFVTIGGQPAASYFDNAHEHALWRTDDAHNLELNFLYNPCGCDNCSCLQLSWLMGVRYFEFRDNLLWGTASFGTNFGDNGGLDEAYLNMHTDNNLVGFQIGNRLDWCIAQRCKFYAQPTFGIYGNHADSDSHLYRGDGLTTFDIRASKDTVAFIGEIDLGLDYSITQCLSARIGYRAMVASGVALTDNQIPPFLAASDEFADVKTNGDLILHGAFAGLEFCF